MVVFAQADVKGPRLASLFDKVYPLGHFTSVVAVLDKAFSRDPLWALIDFDSLCCARHLNWKYEWDAWLSSWTVAIKEW